MTTDEQRETETSSLGAGPADGDVIVTDNLW